MKTTTIILAIFLFVSCSQDPSIVHVDGDYVITMEKYTGHSDDDNLRTQVKHHGILMYNSYLAFEEKHYVKVNADTIGTYFLDQDIWYTSSFLGEINHHTVCDSLYCYLIATEDSLTHIDYIDSLSICNELEMALADIERDKLKEIKESVAKALKQAQIDSVEYWRNNVKEICK